MRLKMALFCLNIFKKSDNAAHDCVQEDVKDFIQKIESMEETINLNLFNKFFESSSPVDYAKMLINIKNADENKQKIVEEVEDKISYLKDRIKRMSEKEKKDKNADETLKITKKFLITINMFKKLFSLHQKLIKENQNQRLKKVLQKGQY